MNTTLPFFFSEAPGAQWMRENQGLLTLFIIAGFAVIFPLFWCGVVWLISRMGWRKLAAHYAVDRPPPGGAEHVMCGMVSLATYRGVLRYRPDADGFYLWPMVLFRTGHPPLYIPWSDVQSGPVESTRRYQFVVLKVGDPLIATIRLMGVSLAGTPLEAAAADSGRATPV